MGLDTEVGEHKVSQTEGPGRKRRDWLWYSFPYGWVEKVSTE